MPVVQTSGRAGSVQLGVADTAIRETPRADFGTMVRNGISQGAGAVATGVSVSAPFVPGGAVASAAVNTAAGGYDSAGVQTFPGAGPGMADANGPAPTGNAQQDLMNQTKQMQEMQMSFSLQYLQLQEKMQSENRQFTTISNVMKTKHDTAKSAINNVR